MEVTPEVRSVPLGAKRKRGRPKKLGHCLAMSPPSQVSEPCSLSDTNQGDPDLDVDQEEVLLVPPVVATGHKRKRPQDDLDIVESSPVGVLLGQVRTLQAGLRSSKPPKRAKKLPSQASASQEPTEPPAQINAKPPPPKMCKKSKAPRKAKKLPSQASGSQEPTEPPAQINAKLPPPLICKKAKNTCNHTIVFDKHYNKALWAKYAEYVKSKKSTVAIDPDYVA